MTYEEKYLLAEEAINNRHKLKNAKMAPFIYIANQIIVISLLVLSLTLGTDNYFIYMIIPLEIIFTIIFIFFRKQKLSVICNSILIGASLPIFLALAFSTCKEKKSKPYNKIYTDLVSEITDHEEDARALINHEKAKRDNSYNNDRNISCSIYTAATVESILIGFLIINLLKEHEKLKQLDGYPLFEVNFTQDTEEKINKISEEINRRRRDDVNEYL